MTRGGHRDDIAAGPVVDWVINVALVVFLVLVGWIVYDRVIRRR